MRRRRPPAWLLALLLTAVPAVARAQAVVNSAGPQSVAVTVYRDPNRAPADDPNLNLLNGYALISETRTVTLPAGTSEVRFEGVASGIFPQSAIVTGFPEGVVERNRDAYLLSPGTLLERSLGRRVTIRRTSGATGAVRQEEAVIRTGIDGAVVLQTGAGFESLRCTGLDETLVYPEVPAGLSTRPTLSVRARSSRPVTATVTLSYLAGGFDWQANYIADLAPDERHLRLFAWLTLASTDETSFPDAGVQAVAGQVNREAAEVQEPEVRPLNLTCWPAARTSDIPLEEWQRLPLGPLPPPAPMMAGDTIVVTGSRMRRANLESASPITVIAGEEALGDLKLFRVPVPVTVAANGQKQVALLVQPRVQVAVVHRQRIDVSRAMEARPATRFLVTRNRTAEGLGLTLPGGSLSLFTQGAGRRLLIGQGSLADRAVGEDVEIAINDAAGVRAALAAPGKADADPVYRLTATNDGDRPIRYEAELEVDTASSRLEPSHARLGTRDGRPLWAVTIPAHGRAVLRYRLRNR